MKQLICTESGNIYYATIRESGLLSSKDRVDLTEDAISAVVDHLTTMDDFASKGLSGYSMHNKNGMEARLVLFDTSKFNIVPIESNDKVIYLKDYE